MATTYQDIAAASRRIRFAKDGEAATKAEVESATRVMREACDNANLGPALTMDYTAYDTVMASTPAGEFGLGLGLESMRELRDALNNFFGDTD